MYVWNGAFKVADLISLTRLSKYQQSRNNAKMASELQYMEQWYINKTQQL